MLVQAVNIEKRLHSLERGEVTTSFVRTGIFLGVHLYKRMVPNFPLNFESKKGKSKNSIYFLSSR